MFSKFELTNKGAQLLNRVIAEEKTLKFTKFQIGKGDFSGDKKTLTQLVSKIDEFNVSQTNVLADGITNIKGFYDNRNLSVASKLTEIGIMAQLGDDNLTEVLFSYSNQPNAEAETIPSKESYFSRTFSVMNRTDNVTSVTFDLTIKQDKYNFGTLAEMKAADYLDVGDKVTLWGNAALGDSSFKMYIITDQAQPIQLNNKLYAKEYFKIVNDLTTGGANKAGSAEMVKKLGEDKQDKTDDTLETNSKKIVGAINEVNSRGYLLLKKYNVEDISLKPKELKTPAIQGNLVLTNKISPNNFLGYWSDGLWINTYNNSDVPIATQLLFSKGNNNIGIRKAPNYNGDTWGEIYEILTTKSKSFLGTLGVNSFEFIQTPGTKTRYKGYVDGTTGKLYMCFPTDLTKDTVDDVTVTGNFILATNLDNVLKKITPYASGILYNDNTSITPTAKAETIIPFNFNAKNIINLGGGKLKIIVSGNYKLSFCTSSQAGENATSCSIYKNESAAEKIEYDTIVGDTNGSRLHNLVTVKNLSKNDIIDFRIFAFNSGVHFKNATATIEYIGG